MIYNKICEYCGKEFTTNRERIRFCSAKCGNLSRRKQLEPRYCELCGKELTHKQNRDGNRFCGNSCSMKHSKATFTYKPIEYTNELRNKLSKSMKNNWKNPEFRANNYKRMTENNPVYMPGIVEKIVNSQNKNGTRVNNFKAGNDKISKVEQIAYDILIPLGYIYNYAISMRELRVVYPEKKFANNYKPDFVNLKKKIAIEIDGNNHNRKSAKLTDNKKEFALNYYGYKVYRFSNDFVKNHTKEFRKEIEKICMEN